MIEYHCCNDCGWSVTDVPELARAAMREHFMLWGCDDRGDIGPVSQEVSTKTGAASPEQVAASIRAVLKQYSERT